MQKIYSRINWENFPSEKTAVNESNLNKMDLAIDNLDDRVVAMDASKVELTKANELVKEILWDESNGTLTVVKMNGSRAIIDTKLEKLAVNFKYDPQTQQLVITLDDGTVQNVDLSSLITEYEFLDSDTIAFEIAGGKVKANVKNGSITEDHLSPDYLGEIRTQVGRAEMSAKSADASEKNAVSSSALAKSYAVGGTGTRDGEDTDNARYYMEQAKAVSAVDIATTEKAGIVKPDGTTITADEDGTLHGVAKITVDTALSSTSTNPVQNKVVKAYVDKKVSENVDFSTSTSKLLNDTVEAPLMLGKATRNLLNPSLLTLDKNYLEYYSGITGTINSDGSITLNGTATRSIWTFLYTTYGSGNNNMFKGLRVFTNLKHNESDKYGELYMAYCRNNYGAQEIWRSKNNGDLIPDGNGEPAWVRLHITSGATFDNETFFIMLTDDDAGAVNDELIPYSGYDIKTIGMNLLPYPYATASGIVSHGVTMTYTKEGTIAFDGTVSNDNIQPCFALYRHAEKLFVNDINTLYSKYDTTIKGSLHTFFQIFKNNGDSLVTNVETLSKNDYDWTNYHCNYVIQYHKTSGDVHGTVSNIRIVTDADDPFVPYTESTAHIDSSTEFPLLGLKSFDGETNIISPGNVEVTYAKSDSGAAILDMSENKLDKDNVVNNQTTTVEGFALDARQANPNIDGTLAKQISDLNGSLNSKKIPSFGIENIFTGNPFCIVNNGSDVISVQTDWDIDNGGYRVKNIQYPAGTATSLTVSLSLPANSIVIVDVSTLNGENIDIQGSLIRSNFTSSPKNWNLSIKFTGRTNQILTDIRYMPLVIHLG